MKQYHYHDVDFRGTIERVIYTVTTPAGKILNKYAMSICPTDTMLPILQNAITSFI